MLAALTVRDIVLIEQAALEFGPGLNVLTGETGAGKSILLDSLGLAVGGRGRAGVRPGAAQGSATAVFDPAPGHGSRTLLLEQAMNSEGEIVLRRSLSADGKSRAFINDQAVGVGLLKELGGLLLEVHGQSDDRGLFDTATHRGLLDSFGGLEESGPRPWRKNMPPGTRPASALAGFEGRAAEAQRNADYVRAAAAELSDFAPEAGRRRKAGGRTRPDDERRPHRRGSQRRQRSAVGRARRRGRPRLGPEEIVSPAAKKPASASPPRKARWNRPMPRPRKRGANWTGCSPAWTPTPPCWKKRKNGCSRCGRWRANMAAPPMSCRAVTADFLAQREALDGNGQSLKSAEAVVAPPRAEFVAASRKAFQCPRRRRQETGKRGGRGIDAAQAGPRQIPRRAGRPGRRGQRQRAGACRF